MVKFLILYYFSDTNGFIKYPLLKNVKKNMPYKFINEHVCVIVWDMISNSRQTPEMHFLACIAAFISLFNLFACSKCL